MPVLSPPLDHAAIAGLVPHHGAMCLLDRAIAWDASRILCETGRHRDDANPLRRDGMLPAVCGLEFALQAMALHGAVGAAAAQSVGFVSSLRDIRMNVDRLDTVQAPLLIEAVALVAETGGFIYRFDITADGRSLLSGQAAVILPGEAA
ncbi:phosphotransferase [Humitalea sp. 24SJ18S-53]|uniref:phosphotransferase n=1 Tax=Humitalea sp. 24SJ18S-53 TaxID=3422307 RepID=UPI003D6661D1